MTITADTLNGLVSITQFNKGQANKIFERLKTERQLVVLKNNKPSAVILSPDEFEKMSEAVENLHLLQMAEARLKPDWESSAISHDDFWRNEGVTEEDASRAQELEIE